MCMLMCVHELIRVWKHVCVLISHKFLLSNNMVDFQPLHYCHSQTLPQCSSSPISAIILSSYLVPSSDMED